MPTIIRREKRVDWLYYESEVNEEDYKLFLEDDEKFINKLWDLDWKLKHQKSGNDDIEYLEKE